MHNWEERLSTILSSENVGTSALREIDNEPLSHAIIWRMSKIGIFQSKIEQQRWKTVLAGVIAMENLGELSFAGNGEGIREMKR